MPDSNLSLWQRATAAIGGAVASAVVVNPLEGKLKKKKPVSFWMLKPHDIERTRSRKDENAIERNEFDT